MYSNFLHACKFYLPVLANDTDIECWVTRKAGKCLPDGPLQQQKSINMTFIKCKKTS